VPKAWNNKTQVCPHIACSMTTTIFVSSLYFSLWSGRFCEEHCIISCVIFAFTSLMVSGKSFIWSFATLSAWWSNQVLPFLWIVLFLSFVKQVYNYLFVAVEKQNVLLPINLIGIAIGIPLGIYLIPRYGLFGGAITQLFIEFMFMIGAIWIGGRKKLQPIFSRKKMRLLLGILIVVSVGWYFINQYYIHSFLWFFVVALVLNACIVLLSRRSIKAIAKGLTVEDAIMEDALIEKAI